MGRRKRTFDEARSLCDSGSGSNALLEKFYREQGLVESEEEFETLLTSLRSPLPVTFRVTGFRQHSRSLLQLLRKNYLDKLVNLAEVPSPAPLPWYPDRMAYQLPLNRLAIRKVTELQKLHSFLITECETGHISRQEAVSMIPPLVLGVQPGDRILDMCAAPGSKTAQLMELLHRDSPTETPTGLVVANDVDQRRAYLMVHQVKRLQSPSFIVCTHDSSVFPRLQLREDRLRFQRVLADVPCSGDGTARKNPGVWKRWKPGLGNNLHLTQAKILRRGAELLAVGGRIVYSTCSLNPVENEAVVAKVLAEADGALELVDARDQLPGLVSLPGLTSWKVMGADGSVYTGYDQVPEGRSHAYLRPSFFAPDADDSDRLNLGRCMRLLPHLQDTGGFFVAAIEKRRCLPWMRDETVAKATGAVANDDQSVAKADVDVAKADDDVAKADDDVAKADDDVAKVAESSGSPKSKRRRYHEDPFLFLSPDSPTWLGISDTFGISDSTFPVRNVLYRCENSKKRHLYLVNDAARQLAESNPDSLKIVNMGVKVFSICDDNDYKGYRPLQEGMTLLQRHVTKRRVSLTNSDLLTLLKHELPFADRFCEETRRAWRELSIGPVVLDYQPQEGHQLPDVPLCLAGWRGRATLRAYMSKHERLHLATLCGIEELKEVKGKTGRVDGGGEEAEGEEGRDEEKEEDKEEEDEGEQRDEEKDKEAMETAEETAA